MWLLNPLYKAVIGLQYGNLLSVSNSCGISSTLHLKRAKILIKPNIDEYLNETPV